MHQNKSGKPLRSIVRGGGGRVTSYTGATFQVIPVKEGIMKPQTRPVIVEVKRKRGFQDRARSIWSGVDLSRAVAEVAAEAGEQHNMQSVDSVAPSTNVVEEQIPEGEQSMANPQEAELPKVDVQTPVAVEAPKSRAKTPRVKKAKPEPVKRTPKAVSKAAESEPAVAPSKRRTYSGKERAQKIAQIRKLIAGGSSVKSAVAEVKISEQTYYYWMKAVPAEESDDLKDLVALEAENKELKKRLAEHLRKENAELKRKLGI